MLASVPLGASVRVRTGRMSSVGSTFFEQPIRLDTSVSNKKTLNVTGARTGRENIGTLEFLYYRGGSRDHCRSLTDL